MNGLPNPAEGKSCSKSSCDTLNGLGMAVNEYSLNMVFNRLLLQMMS